MRILPRLTLPLLLVALGFLGVATEASAQGPTTITISFTNGQITVSPENATVRKGAQVRWASSDPSAVWIVAFPGSTPFANGQKVFNGGGPGSSGGPIPPGTASGEHKYWVFYPDASGNYRILDPKLVVVD